MTLKAFGTVVFAAFMMASQVSSSQPLELPADLTEQVVAYTQSAFWGNAVGTEGQKITLPPDVDPSAPVIPTTEARRIVHAAVPTGFAMWCGVEWQPFYLDFMQRERSSGVWSETQLAYIGVLFGMSQQITAMSASSQPCSEKQRAETTEKAE